ncbi:MAG: ABC transporter ATP-binding protein [Clostridiales bacterium]|jgi:oligopeptide/dipeptide ABC transporter ATP-binding protein|nr:ABC transporter ATP-binding protein [Clostridiales bacterium]
MKNKLLELKSVSLFYPGPGRARESRNGMIRALDNVSLQIQTSEALGLVGESGCGKTTLGKIVAGLLQPDSGRLLFLGKPHGGGCRREIQMVFQDSQGSLNPRMKIGKLVEEGLIVGKAGKSADRRRIVLETLSSVGLAEDCLNRYSHEFSGGQRQRISLARTLVLQPKLLVLDEPVSSLDVTVQAQLINLLALLKRERKISYLFISHNLAVVRQICERVAVMYMGKIVEIGPASAVFSSPKHFYTAMLLDSQLLPESSQKNKIICATGEPRPIINGHSGCRFYTRCVHAVQYCRHVPPPLQEVGYGHRSACHLQGNAGSRYGESVYSEPSFCYNKNYL